MPVTDITTDAENLTMTVTADFAASVERLWSAFTTLGANTSAVARKNLNLIAIVVAVVLYVGFMIMPLAVLFRVI